LKEAELRSGVEKVRNLTDAGWQYLEAKGFVEAAAEEIGEAEEDPVGYLVAELDLLYAAAPTRVGVEKPRGRTTNEERVPPQLSDYELERSESFSQYLAKLAAPDGYVRESTQGPVHVYPIVKGFRRKYLDDALLSPEQAQALLTSPVAARWPHLEFRCQGIPVVGHKYQVEEDKHDDKGPYSLVKISVSGSRNPWFKDRRELKAGAWEWLDAQGDAKTNAKPRREFKTGFPPKDQTWKILSYPGADGVTHRTVVRPSSVLGDLHELVSRLIRRYPWEESDAVWFVLTGETPWVAPLTWQFRGTGGGLDSWSYGRITLRVEPWVPAQIVKQVYSSVQHQLLGKDNKRIGEKNRELFRFVIGRMGPGGSLPKARELVKEWDRENPQWRYGHDDTNQVRRFRRDYNLARRSLAAPNYELDED
jgi:hypothetical protein